MKPPLALPQPTLSAWAWHSTTRLVLRSSARHTKGAGRLCHSNNLSSPCLLIAPHYQVFHYEILGDPTTAIDTAKTAFEEAIPKLESLAGEEEYKVAKHTLPGVALSKPC